MTLTNIFKIFKDGDRKEQIEFIDLGILPAGDTQRYTLYVLNDSELYCQKLIFKIVNQMGEEVNVLEAPETMRPGGFEKVIVEWTAKADLVKSLRANFNISGEGITT